MPTDACQWFYEFEECRAIAACSDRMAPCHARRYSWERLLRLTGCRKVRYRPFVPRFALAPQARERCLIEAPGMPGGPSVIRRDLLASFLNYLNTTGF